MKKKILLPLFLTAAILTPNTNAAYKEPYNASRILWDTSSQVNVFNGGNYSRIIQLQDGRLLAVAEKGNGIATNYSNDYGKTWTREVVIAPNGNIPYAVPDVIQLTDGTIIVGFNPRPSSPYSEDRLFGIRCVISYDNGESWTDPIYIFDAKHTFDNGCWEPQLIELPSGEIHCYFANENDYTSSSEQCISMCRSFDKGLTWSEPVKVSFRSGTRDGMPVAIITDNGEIAVIIEDNGWPSYKWSFRATVVRCSLEDNWSETILADSPNREIIFANDEDKQYISAAPYLRKLHTGETIASWQGNHGGRSSSYLNMFVAVGNEDARNFSHVTEPFSRSETEHALWNSVSVIGDGSVLAVASLGGATAGNSIYTKKGWPKQYFDANFGTPTIDGVNTKDGYTYKYARQVYMGQYTGTRATADFLWDNDNLYFTVLVSDSDVYTDLVDNDGVTFSIDTKGASDQYPQEGIYKMFFDANGTVTNFKYGSNNRWVATDTPEDINYSIKINKTYYTIEAAIPWKVLGLESAPVDNDMRVNIAVTNRKESSIETENLPETTALASWTWFWFKLNPAPDSSIETIAAENNTVTAITAAGRLHVSSREEIASLSLHSLSGALLHSATRCGTSHSFPIPATGIGVLHVTTADGQTFSKKIAF